LPRFASYVSSCSRVSVAVSLCSHVSAVHRAFLSFPTRRSSDLSERGLVTLAVGARARDRGDLARALDLHAAALPAERARLDVAQDRKSTRLNSSHQIISYAVFCLKKKHIHPLDRGHV